MPKVVFITGGSSGIGKAIGEYLQKKNCIVYGTSRTPEKYAKNSKFSLLKMEVTETESILTAINKLIEKEGRIDVVINNAGVGITGPMEETPVEEMRNAFETNYFGPINLINTVLPQLREQHSGIIINVTSIAGYMGLPYRGIYSATKAALEITTEAYSMEIRQFGIKMVNVAPGEFSTNIAASRYHAPILDESPYKKEYGETLAIMNKHVDGGDDPIKMAEAIYAIIESKNPKIHYKVGAFLQKFSIALKRVLPDKVYEGMLLKHYNLK